MNLFGFDIRPATVDDFHQLSGLFDELDEIHRRARPDLFRKPDGPPREFAEIERLIAGPHTTIIVAEDRPFRQLVGFTTIIIRESPGHRVRPARTIVEIDNFGVSKPVRRQGIGRSLIQAAIQWAANRGFETLELAVLEFNLPAISFYQAMGFDTIVRRMSNPTPTPS